MATVRLHPLQQQYKHSGGAQYCTVCGAQEQWTAATQPTVQGAKYDRALHLTHLVREHLADLQSTFSAAERKKEQSVTDPTPEEEAAEEAAE